MRSVVQAAIAEGLAALSSEAGVDFTHGGIAVTAWPIQALQLVAGRIDSTPDSLLWFETNSAPSFEKGANLIGSDGLVYKVSRREPFNPTTQTFKFAVYPGRSA